MWEITHEKRQVLVAVSALLSISTLSAQEISPQLRASLPKDRPHIKANRPVKDRIGNIQYRINLNPFVVEEFRRSSEGQEIEKKIESETQRLRIIADSAKGDMPVLNLSYHNSGVLLAARSLERKYNLKIESAESSLSFTLYAAIDPETIQKKFATMMQLHPFEKLTVVSSNTQSQKLRKTEPNQQRLTKF